MPPFIAGNKRVLYIGLQSAKGTPQTTPTLKIRVRNFNKGDVRQKIELEETDASTQDGESVVVGVGGSISFEKYLRPSEDDFLWYALLGVNADSGTNPNFTHTQSPAVDTPYLTIFEEEPNVWCNRYSDVRVTLGTARGGAGQALGATYTLEWLDFLAGVTAPVSPGNPTSELPYIYPEVTNTLGASAPGTVDEFELTVARGGSRAQGDVGFKSQDYINGKLVVSGTITKFNPADASGDDYMRAIDTGAVAGTTPTATIYTEALNIKAVRSAQFEVNFDMDEVEYTTRQADVRTDGSPVIEVLAFRTPPQPTLAGDITAIYKNAKATPQTTPPA
jgi:hypothetical protein